ncbi:MAG: YncE family protein [Alkaliphilus sp.]|nr:YncE family protein [Alkaliphilus sp.]
MKCFTDNTLIVSNFFEDSISIVNLVQGKEIQKIKLCDSGHHFSSPQFGPHHMALCYERKLLYVPNSWNNSISIIDLVKVKVIDTVYVGSCPSQVILCPKYGHIYVANTDSNSISILDMDKLNLIVQLPTGEMPHGMAMTNNEEKIFVGSYGSGEITEILTKTNEKVKDHKVQCNPWHLRMDGSGKFLYVVNYSNQFNRNGKIFIYEIGTLTEKNRINIGKMPIETISDNQNQYLYVTDFDMDCVHIYDLKNNRYNDCIKVNPMPHGIELDSKKGRLFVTSMGKNTVDIVDICKKMVIQSILVGREPTSVVKSTLFK